MKPPDDIATIRGALAVIVLVALLAWETGQPFFEHFNRGRPGWTRRARHAGLNLALGALNAGLVAFVFVGAWLGVTTWAAQMGWGLLNVVAPPPWLRWLAAIVLLDLWTYTWHWLNHRLPLLWRFHRLHHSDPHMDVTTANRFHLVEVAASGVLRIPILALIGCRMDELALYEILFFACVQFHHANIALPASVDRVVGWFVVTPFVHKVHHSIKAREANSNYGSLLTVWDRLFRTLQLAPDPRAIRFGVDDHTGPRR